MGGIFVKNSFILGKKLNTPKNFLLSVEAKFNRGISLIISTVIWSYVTPFFKWRQKDEWNSLEDSRAPFPVEKTIAIRLMGKKMPSAKHWFCWQCFVNPDGNRKAFTRGLLSIFFVLLLKNVIFRNRLKKLNFDKTFEWIIENELDFHDYGTAKIEIQQQPDDMIVFRVNYAAQKMKFSIKDFFSKLEKSFLIECFIFCAVLLQTFLNVLDFNPTLKAINSL